MVRRAWEILKRLVNRTVVVAGGLALTLIFFLVLPLMQSLNDRMGDLVDVRRIDTAVYEEPPPEVEEEEEEEEEEPEPEPPPEMTDTPPPLDLSQLELALNPGMGGGYGAATMAVDLSGALGAAEDIEELFASDLDQPPRALSQQMPSLPPELQKRTPARVVVIFIVDETGRVRSPKVIETSDDAFNRVVMEAVRKWTFEPGESRGEPRRSRMRIPITLK